MSGGEGDFVDPLVEPLTRREREILALQAQDHSAPEIAAKLTLALSSVKWYIQQLYGKLGASSKQQAVARGQALGLLEPPAAAATPPTVSALEPLPGSAPIQATRPREPLPKGPPVPALRHNLPLQLTNFIGRASQIAEVKRLLHSIRLLTLIGPGGTGKTRLALQIAADSLDQFEHGAWLVELAPIAEPAQVPQAVAHALALRAETADAFEAVREDSLGRDALSLIVDHLSNKSLLLTLDNCEHMVGACAQLAEQLLRAAPGLRILATSREALGVTGEKSYPVPTLSVPDLHQLPPLETLAESEAVRLFVERAGAVRLDFALTEENAPAVAQICRSLDGIPLAIELAAARARALTVEQIAIRLAEHDRLRLLTGGSRSAPPRQQTLRGAIDWSYELLTDGERALLRRLSVFAGGWTLEAAEQVAGGPEVLDGLTQLVGKSLALSTQQPRQAARFSMLETIRQYAQEKLAASGEAESARGRHLAYYLALAEEAEPELRGSGQVKWLNRLDQESDNLRGALAWAVKSEDAESAQRMAGALTYFWWIRDYGAEGRRWLEDALHLQTSGGSLGSSAWQARALLGAGWLDRGANLSVSLSRLEKALVIYRELGDKSGMAHGLLWLGTHRRVAQKDNKTALGHYQEALDLWTAADDGWGVGICLHWMGHVAEDMGDRAMAQALYQRSVDMLREQGDRWQFIWPLSDLASYEWANGDAVRARPMFEEGLAAAEEVGSQNRIVHTAGFLSSISAAQGDYARARETALRIGSNPTGLVRLGEVDYLQGRLAEARQLFEAGLEGFRAQKELHGQAWPLARLGCVAYRLGELAQSALLLEQSVTFLGPDGWWWNLALAVLTQGDLARGRGEPERAAELYARSFSIVIKETSLPDLPERLEGFAKLAGAAQQPERAARLFGAAAALRERFGTPVPPVERADYDLALALAREHIDPAAFNAAWTEGMAMSWEHAAAFALET